MEGDCHKYQNQALHRVTNQLNYYNHQQKFEKVDGVEEDLSQPSADLAHEISLKREEQKYVLRSIDCSDGCSGLRMKS